MRGGFPENLTNVPQKIAVLRRDDSSNLAFHRQKSKFTKKGLARAWALPAMPSHIRLPALSAMGGRRQIAIIGWLISQS
jgi:hypothetical protein